jgi:hypothetical protein
VTSLSSSVRRVRYSIMDQPLLNTLHSHLIAYPTPSNLNASWNWGSLAGLCLVLQIVTGVCLAMHYTAHVDPVKIAMCDEQFYEIEKVLAHTGQFNKKDTLFFKVKWLGYGPEENTFDPWTSELWNLEVMHEYLRANKLKQLIPAKFK